MTKEQCFYLGKVAKKFSFKGEVLIYLDTDEVHLYKKLESVFIDFHETLVPFFIEKSQIHKIKFLRVKFDDVNSEQQAEELLNKEVYLPLAFLPKLSDEQFYYHEIIGFKVKDAVYGSVGNIKSVNDSGVQVLLEIEHNQTQILLPLIDEFIEKVDKKNQVFYIKAPQGLIDLYLNPQ